MRSTIPLIVVIFSILTSGSIFAAGDGGYAGSFLQLGVGARPLGMGSAFTAISDDATGLFWNPAGLAQTGKKQIAAAYSEMFEGRRQTFFGLVVPSSAGSFGVGWLSYGISGISRRDVSGQSQGEFSSSENAFGLAYAKGLEGGIFDLMIGGGAKLLYHKLADNKATGYGGDLGLLAKIQLPGLVKKLAVGMALQNIGANLKWDTESEHEEEIPLDVRVGAALSVFALPLDLAFDVEKSAKQDPTYHLGAEYWLAALGGLRVGWDDGDIAAGASFRLSSLGPEMQFDYGFSTDPVSPKGIHRVCVSAGF